MSPNGAYLAFMSDSSELLRAKGYDNHDATEPQARDEEVLEYSATYRSIICVSCNPTGARPHGVLDVQESGEGLGLLVDRPQLWEGRWLAGSIPGWTARHLAQSDYQARYLSDTGRLFFNSSDSLVPQDTNGKDDVYEYEPDDIGGCAGGQAQGGGCIALVSSGGSPQESAFLDASENGDDVFFLTTATLASEDKDTSYDVYDAHACTTEAPCALVPHASAPVCTTLNSCEPNPTNTPGSEPPLSSTFQGAGAPPPAAAPSSGGSPKASAPRLTRAEKLKSALHACAHKPRRQRKACEARARKRYGASKAHKASRVHRSHTNKKANK
jgi:hypothetical protein